MERRKQMEEDEQQHSLSKKKESNELEKSETKDTVVIDLDDEDLFYSPTRTNTSKNWF